MSSMERSEIIKFFLNSGYQLDPKSLQFFEKNPDQMVNFLEKIKTLNVPMITFDFVEKLLKPTGLKILRDFSQQKKVHTVEDYTNFFSKRYDQIKKFLVKKPDLTDLVSINRITDRIKKFSLIVLVKETSSEGYLAVVEDGTGELKISFDKKVEDFSLIVPDEVIGLVCKKQGFEVYADKIVWPDIPLKKQVAKSSDDIFCLFISDFHMDSKEFKKQSYENFLNWLEKAEYKDLFIFILGDVSSNKKHLNNLFGRLSKYNKFFLRGEVDPFFDDTLNNPSLVEIQGVTIFLSHDDVFSEYATKWTNLPPEKIFLNLIKKRHLNPIFNNKIYDEDPYFLNVVPDIFVSGHFHLPGIVNYKGITIISNGSFITQPIFWLINLRTRETFKIDFT